MFKTRRLKHEEVAEREVEDEAVNDVLAEFGMEAPVYRVSRLLTPVEEAEYRDERNPLGSNPERLRSEIRSIVRIQGSGGGPGLPWGSQIFYTGTYLGPSSATNMWIENYRTLGWQVALSWDLVDDESPIESIASVTWRITRVDILEDVPTDEVIYWIQYQLGRLEKRHGKQQVTTDRT